MRKIIFLVLAAVAIGAMFISIPLVSLGAQQAPLEATEFFCDLL